MQVTEEQVMARIGECDVADCVYNAQMSCHARAITIGDTGLPACDTYFRLTRHTSRLMTLGQVGACKMQECSHNLDFQCNAPEVRVTRRAERALCATYTKLR